MQTLQSHPPWNRGKCPLCRAEVSLYSTMDLAAEAPLGILDVDTIFGCVYLQGGSIGQASYHFDAPDNVYISYENAPEFWKLDDGSPPPKQKPFEDPKYDAATRTFTGTITWSDSPFNGDTRWDYTMVFSDDFSVICSGALRAFSASGEESKGESFPLTLRYWRQRAPPTCIRGCAFMQAGMLGLASYHFPASEIAGSYISYEAAPPSWTLENGSPPPKQKPFLDPRYDEETRTFTGWIDWSDSPFGGDARWEYTMTFSDDFQSIAGGTVKALGADGVPRNEHAFGQDLFYTLYVEEAAQMRHLLRDLNIEPF